MKPLGLVVKEISKSITDWLTEEWFLMCVSNALEALKNLSLKVFVRLKHKYLGVLYPNLHFLFVCVVQILIRFKL